MKWLLLVPALVIGVVLGIFVNWVSFYYWCSSLPWWVWLIVGFVLAFLLFVVVLLQIGDAVVGACLGIIFGGRR